MNDEAKESTAGPDALTIGRRVRHFRKAAGLTLTDLGQRVSRAPSQISAIESGRREPTISMLQALATALDVSAEDLLDPTPVDHRAALEIQAERAQASALYSSLRLPRVRTKALPTDALEAIVGLQRELQTMAETRAATPEEARRANRDLRERMSRAHNYFGDLEDLAAELLAVVDYRDGPLSQRQAAGIASHLGFDLHYVADVPASTRSVTDLRGKRIYLPNSGMGGHDPRSTMLAALAPMILGQEKPRDYAEFLRQRVQVNYLAAALRLPESAAASLLKEAKKNRRISIEELRDHFGTTYETAAHRFTNLATEHLGLRVHFMKVQTSGAIHKVYSNDGLPFPTDPLGAVEGQYACKRFTSRQVFKVADRFSPYYQYTDTPVGTYWCTARVLPEDSDFAVSVGVPFNEVRWFEGRETPIRSQSRCPDPSCCRAAPAELEVTWGTQSWPQAKMHASLLAAVPPGAFPGVDPTEVYEFLERHAED
ncbi:helix-turn-helix domain-containing protein [Brevibacterium sp. 91QC2O2]|uniref:helix-turn-helix transcriptional regulator n=1 Tax=Brevibacterium TaxID=1696 RepID=UPI00211C84FB|nr:MULTISPECIES: helix-turn-helix transcriptional regulator [unclassified Brevibacterium]MCQ9369360.1 helix-turn-helix domain-containing protein [Brevibacterium sp. 91QC2O2]MCQ9386510.1 helix-turn-helix domain-containing protein [Brevibacterium sp. 68QC2CO]